MTCRPSSGRNFRQTKLIAKADAADLRLGVLQREVEMTGLREARVGDFAFDPHVLEFAFEQVADAQGQLADFPDVPVGHQIESDLTHALSPEKSRQPHRQREDHAQHDARDNRKIHAAMTPLIQDVSRQAAEPQRELPSHQENGPCNPEQRAENEEQFAGFAQGVHRSLPGLIVPERQARGVRSSPHRRKSS